MYKINSHFHLSCFVHRIFVRMISIIFVCIWLPVFSLAQQIEVTKDIVYAVRPEQPEWPEEQFKLDIYAPAEPGNYSIVVYLHSMSEVKEYGLPLMQALAEKGVIAISINFDGAHPSDAITNHGRGFREMAETAACAIRFAHKKALDYGDNVTQLCLVGFSLGGGLAA
jgi:acetyl esterase/lipase